MLEEILHIGGKSMPPYKNMKHVCEYPIIYFYDGEFKCNYLGLILLPRICKIHYDNKQHDNVDKRLIYVNMYFIMCTCNIMKLRVIIILSHADVTMLNVDINMVHVDINTLHVDINCLACRVKKYDFLLFITLFILTIE